MRSSPLTYQRGLAGKLEDDLGQQVWSSRQVTVGVDMQTMEPPRSDDLRERLQACGPPMSMTVTMDPWAIDPRPDRRGPRSIAVLLLLGPCCSVLLGSMRFSTGARTRRPSRDDHRDAEPQR